MSKSNEDKLVSALESAEAERARLIEKRKKEEAEANTSMTEEEREQAREMEQKAQDARRAELWQKRRDRGNPKLEHKDELAKEEPFVLESSEADPEFPAMEEYEVDEGGAPGTHNPKSGIIWGLIASAAIVVLVIVFMCVGDWSF